MAAEGSREIPKAYRESSLPCIDTKGPKKENEAVKSARKGWTASQRGRGGRIRNMIKLRRGSQKSTNDDSSEERPPNSVIVPDTPLEMSGITQAPISPVSHRHAISVDGYDSIATAGGSSINSVAPERPSNQSLVTSQTIEEYRETQKRQQSALGIKHAKRFMKESSRFVQLDTEQIERIQIMHDQFAEGSAFTFNYNTLLLVASVLAGLGLISNSSTTVIASMLVSPIMGPVVGIAYGLTIHDYKLCKKAHLNFYLSLLFCVGIGVCLGAICGPFEISEAWPTDEMLARGSLQAFLVAIPVAFFSGLGVAVSLLDSQTNSLVGVAISASLLPPAVNAGVLWVTWAFYQDYDHSLNVGANGHIDTRIQQYSGDDFRNAGFISLCITLVNVVLIIVASVFMFRLKEKLPIKKNVFWTDLGTARKIYRNLAVQKATEEAAGRELHAILEETYEESKGYASDADDDAAVATRHQNGFGEVKMLDTCPASPESTLSPTVMSEDVSEEISEGNYGDKFGAAMGHGIKSFEECYDSGYPGLEVGGL